MDPAKVSYWESSLFPLNDLRRLYDSNPETDKAREWAVEGGHDYMIRFLSFKPTAELDIRSYLCRHQTEKLHIGGLYQTQFSPEFLLGHELVIDLDITDYDDKVPPSARKLKCLTRQTFPYMKAAIASIRFYLREAFGFRHILFVFSGKKGIHCWVFDKRAFGWAADVRGFVLRYFPRDLTHPYGARIQERYRHIWETSQQQILQDEGDRAWYRTKLSEHKKEWLLGPVFDTKVTTDRAHLLKVPFSVHPATGNIAVPIWNAETFDLEKDVPRLDPETNQITNREALETNIAKFKKFVSQLPNE